MQVITKQLMYGYACNILHELPVELIKIDHKANAQITNTTKPGVQLLSPNVHHMCQVYHIISVLCDVIYMTAFSATEYLFTLRAQIINIFSLT